MNVNLNIYGKIIAVTVNDQEAESNIRTAAEAINKELDKYRAYAMDGDDTRFIMCALEFANQNIMLKKRMKQNEAKLENNLNELENLLDKSILK